MATSAKVQRNGDSAARCVACVADVRDAAREFDLTFDVSLLPVARWTVGSAGDPSCDSHLALLVGDAMTSTFDSRAVVDALFAMIRAGEPGATIARDGGPVVSGVVVAVQGSPELRICALGTRDRFSLPYAASWVRLPSVARALELDPARCIGAWLDDDNRLCLDVVEIVPTVARALVLATERGEDAVYSLDTGATHYTEQQEPSAAQEAAWDDQYDGTSFGA